MENKNYVICHGKLIFLLSRKKKKTLIFPDYLILTSFLWETVVCKFKKNKCKKIDYKAQMTLQFPITIVSPDRRVISILRNPRPTRAEYSSATFFTIRLFFFLFTFLVYFIFRFRLLCLTPLDPKKQFSWSCADLCFGAHSPFIPLVPPTAPRRRSRKASRMEHTASASSSSFDGDGASRAHREGNERIQWSKERKTHTERDRESERERERNLSANPSEAFLMRQADQC